MTCVSIRTHRGCIDEAHHGVIGRGEDGSGVARREEEATARATQGGIGAREGRARGDRLTPKVVGGRVLHRHRGQGRNTRAERGDPALEVGCVKRNARERDCRQSTDSACVSRSPSLSAYHIEMIPLHGTKRDTLRKANWGRLGFTLFE